MKEAYWGWWIIALGLLIMVVIMVVMDMTTTSEQDYYMVKEITEASMYEAVDYNYYRAHGELKINAEKFMEDFIRRYSETITINKTIDIDFYDLYEMPPKVTVILSNHSFTMYPGDSEMTFDINNRVDAVLEMKLHTKPVPKINN